jgi:hypothetical protein
VKLDFNTGVWESVSKPARDLLARMLKTKIYLHDLGLAFSSPNIALHRDC